MDKLKESLEYGEKYQSFYALDTKVSLADKKGKTPNLIFSSGRDSYYSSADNNIVLGIGSISYWLDDSPCFDTEDEWNINLQFWKGHEEQHHRSTADRAWMYGIENGWKTLVREFSYLLNGKYSQFFKESDYDYFIETELSKHNIHTTKEELKNAAHRIINTMEDGRIERIRSCFRPGFKNILIWYRGNLWKHSPCEKLDISKPQNYQMVFLNNLLSLATCGVYMKGFSALYGTNNISGELYKLIPDIKRAVTANRCKECMDACLDIIAKLAPMYLNTLKAGGSLNGSQNNSQGQPKIGSGQSSQSSLPNMDISGQPTEKYGVSEKDEEGCDGSSFNIFNEDDCSQSSSKNANEQDQSQSNSNNQDANSEKSGSGNPAQDDKQNSNTSFGQGGDSGSKGQHIEWDGSSNLDEIDKLMNDAAKNVRDIVKAATKATTNTAAYSRAKAKTKIDNSKMPSVKDICNNFHEFCRKYQLTYSLPIDYQLRGTVLNNKYRKYFNNLKKPTYRNRKSGRLDTAALYRLKTKDINTFMTRQDEQGFNGCVEIFIDNSGSMGGKKKQEACLAAAIIEEGFKGLLPVKIVAFDSSGGVNYEVIKNWEESFPNNCCYNYFKHSRAGGGTPTANILKIGKKEMLARSEEHKLIILLTDECAYCANSELSVIIRDVRKAGIKLCGIYFEDCPITPEIENGFNELFDGFDNICCMPENIDDNTLKIVESWVRK